MPVPSPTAFPDEPPPELFRAEADLLAALRTFERRSELLAREQGLTPRQYQLLLQIKGAPDGSARATTTELTRRLQLNQSSVSELVQRVLQAGLVRRAVSEQDARTWWLTLTAEGERRLAAIVSALGPERRQLSELLESVG